MGSGSISEAHFRHPHADRLSFLMKLLGYIICSFLLILVFMRYTGSQTWAASILGAALSSSLSYLLFETWLKGQLPEGIFGF